MKNYTISEIEKLTEAEVKTMTNKQMNIKGYNIYFVDLAGGFGYSVLVFRNDHHIYYANDYELHHTNRTHDELKKLYIESLNNKLYTDEELYSVDDYSDYKQKYYFLTNYYIMQIDYISAFRISDGEESDQAFHEMIKDMKYNPNSFCYVSENDVDFCIHQDELIKALINARDKKEQDFNYLKSAFKSEMYNHEYCINYQADIDTISCFTNIDLYRTTNDSYTLEELFEVGKKYTHGWIGDRQLKTTWEVIKRTACSITIRNEEDCETKTCKIIKRMSESDGVECVRPYGKFSMCPILKAN